MDDTKQLISDIEDMLEAVKNNKFTEEEVIDIFCNDFSPRIIKLLKQHA